jgi:tetratricopeptide (TPR) repeat protein
MTGTGAEEVHPQGFGATQTALASIGSVSLIGGFASLAITVPTLGADPSTRDLVLVVIQSIVIVVGASLLVASLASVRHFIAYALLVTAFTLSVLVWVGGAFVQKKFSGHQAGVLVAHFSGPEQEYGVADHILKELQDTGKTYGDIQVVEADEMITPSMGDTAAAELGRRRNAQIVIWGSYYPNPTKVQVDVHFDILTGNAPSSEENFPDTIRNLENFTIHARLSDQAKLVALLVAGISAYINADPVAALQRLATAERYSDGTDKADLAAVYYYEARAYEMRSSGGQAVTAYLKCIRADEYFEDCYLDLGNLFQKNGPIVNAIYTDDAALVLWPNDPHFLNNRGNAEHSAGDWTSALADYNAAIKADPRFWPALSDKGSFEIMLADYSDAKNDYTAALKLAPNDPGLLMNVAHYYAHYHDYRSALRFEDRALAASPSPGVVLMDRALVEAQRGWLADARADLDTARRIFDEQQDGFHSAEATWRLSHISDFSSP